jgi:hypothetical protein
MLHDIRRQFSDRLLLQATCSNILHRLFILVALQERLEVAWELDPEHPTHIRLEFPAQVLLLVTHLK